jgi:uncharacterized membrane protein YkvA (DUF1232 family)
MAKRDISDKEHRILNRLKVKAERIVNDHEALKDVLEKARKKLENAEKDESLMLKLTEYLKLISRMLGNYLNGKYNETPWQTIVMMIAGLLYFIAPIDAIPDFIPVAGLVDDVTVLVWLGKCFREDLANYQLWEDKMTSKKK